MVAEPRSLEQRLEHQSLAKKAFDLGLIGWRQVDRVKLGQNVYVNGLNRTPEQLAELVKEANGKA